METIEFLVQGPHAEPYVVSFIRHATDHMTANCTCPAGSKGTYCTHRFAILAGVDAGIVSPNKDRVPTVRSWLPGSDMAAALQGVHEAELAMIHAEAALAKARGQLARAMHH